MGWVERIKEAKAPVWVVCVMTLVGPPAGALWSDYNTFRNKQIEASVGAVTASREADQKLNDLLVKFAKLALGEGSVSSEDRAEFDRLIYEVNQKAADVSASYPVLKPAYEKYSDSLIELRKASEGLKGAKTGKDFVRATANYAVARDAFRNASQGVSGSYWRTFSL